MSVPFADVPPSTVLLNFGAFGCVVSVVSGFALSSPCIPACGTDRYLTVGIAAASVIAQVRNRKSHTGIVTKINQHSKISPQALMTVAMKFIEAGRFSLLRKCFDMALSFAFQILYFGVGQLTVGCSFSHLTSRPYGTGNEHVQLLIFGTSDIMSTK